MQHSALWQSVVNAECHYTECRYAECRGAAPAFERLLSPYQNLPL